MGVFVYFLLHNYTNVLLCTFCVGKTTDHNHPPSAEHMYEEVGVAGEVKSSHNIHMNFNKAYGPRVKDRIHTSANPAYEQV